GVTQSTSTVAYNGTLGTPTAWGASSITVPVPSGATTGNVVVTVGGQASNGVSFAVTVPPLLPNITSLTPTSGPVGTVVTISRATFRATQGGSTVRCNGRVATATGWRASSITAPVPPGATTGSVVVSTPAGSGTSPAPFTVLAGIALVQRTTLDAGSTTSATLPFPASTAAGD